MVHEFGPHPSKFRNVLGFWGWNFENSPPTDSHQAVFLPANAFNAPAPPNSLTYTATMSLKQMAADIGAQLGNCNTTHCACGRYLDSDPGAVPDSPFPQTPCSFEEGDGLSFRLVDVNSGCIKHASLDDRYIALSYICCKEDIFRVDENMLASLSVEGALAGTSLRLSKTISDAIDFTREMGERYLWVDALCLAYDNQDDVDRGLWISNSIWSNAYLTLVAASGDHADAGLLPELSELPDCPTTMTGFDALEEELSRSAFSTRGWTLHELAFSRRLAIFLNGQVHYYCRESEQRCNSDLLPNRARVDHLRTFSLRFGIPNSLDGAIPSMIAYRSLCEAYSLRKLRREGDSIRALASANRSLLAGMKSIGVEGLPGYYIGYFQLFYSPHGNLRRRPEFASFSWAGWEGEIRWPRHEVDETDPSNLLRWIRDKPLVDWNALRPDAHLHYLSDISLEEGPSLLEVFVRRLPQIFSQQAVQGFVEDRTAAAAYGLYNSSSGWESCPDSWDEHIKAWRGGERPVLPLDFFPSEALDTVNSSRELGEMLRRIDGTKFGKAKQSWYAQQRYSQSTPTKLARRLLIHVCIRAEKVSRARGTCWTYIPP